MIDFYIYFHIKEVSIILYNLYHQKDYLESKLKFLSESLSNLPEGKLIYSRCGNHTKWFKSNGSSPLYIPKKERPQAQKLALRKYYTFQLEEANYKLKLINSFLKHYLNYPDKASEMLSEASYYKELLNDYIDLPSEAMDKWIHTKYPANPKNPENLIHKCLFNHNVRSKSEVIIANSLFQNKIPYRYECELNLGDVTLYPDFTICHPQTLEIYYWEHFGMMDKRQYRQSAASKLVLYGDFGIYPSINLITTYETATHPIDSEKIEQLIHEYFL